MSPASDAGSANGVLGAFKEMLKSQELQRRFVEERGLRA
jgi:hypothetical protein